MMRERLAAKAQLAGIEIGVGLSDSDSEHIVAAVLDALRDPTPEMIEAVRKAVSGYPHPESIVGIWQVMITAAKNGS